MGMRERGDDTQRRAAGRTQTVGRWGEDKASAHRPHAPPTELAGRL